MGKYILSIISVFFIVAFSYSLYYSIKWSNICNETVSVTGTIYGKSGQIVSKYKSTKVYTDYYFAIKPDNPQYKDFDIIVSFSTFAKYNEGDKITFIMNKYKVMQSDIDPNKELTLSIVFAFVSFMFGMILTIISIAEWWDFYDRKSYII